MCQPPGVPHGVSGVPVADLALGNSVGAIGMVSGHCRYAGSASGAGCLAHPFHVTPAPSPLGGGSRVPLGGPALGSYLVDSASSHMLVSKIKPCMSKYKHSCTVKLRMAH
jgi:hypothetical protein